MKEAFIDVRLSGKYLRVVEQACEIIDEYVVRGFKLTKMSASLGVHPTDLYRARFS